MIALIELRGARVLARRLALAWLLAAALTPLLPKDAIAYSAADCGNTIDCASYVPTRQWFHATSVSCNGQLPEPLLPPYEAGTFTRAGARYGFWSEGEAAEWSHQRFLCNVEMNGGWHNGNQFCADIGHQSAGGWYTTGWFLCPGCVPSTEWRPYVWRYLFLVWPGNGEPPTCTGQGTAPYDVGRETAFACPINYQWDSAGKFCYRQRYENQCVTAGNPIHIGTWAKSHAETDYEGTGAYPLRWTRRYDSQGNSSPVGASRPAGRMGAGWRSDFERYVDVWSPASGAQVVLTRADGSARYFTPSGNGYAGRVGEKGTLTRQTDAGGATTGWTYVTESEETETYDAAGRLVSLAARGGPALTLAYGAAGELASVTDPSGRSLTLTHDAQGRVTEVLDPAGGRIAYGYDAQGNLTQVTFPDARVKQYLYEHATVVHGLTGIVDENGSRFATYSYDSSGRAVAEEHAGGVNRYSVNTSTGAVTDPLGTVRTYSWVLNNGTRRLQRISQPCASCGDGATSYITYDANGNVASRTDYNGNKTNYVHDLSRNLETSRTEAVGKPEARTVTTQWHPTLRLPTRISEPGRTTDYTYDATGKLLTRTVTDTAGGTTRTWTYAYTTAQDGTLPGLLKTVDGPRGDVADLATYAYTPNGDLASVTNALGQVTQVSARDAHGRPTGIVDPNGLVTTLTYGPRGRLASRSVGGEATAYAYDAAGQLTRVTLPDGSFLEYAYDAAHRLTEIRDSQANRIAYTLDAAGNRTKEEIFDPQGTLAQTRSRVFNSLGRLAQDVGAAGQTTQYGYDAQGNLSSVTDPLNRVTGNAFDALNRLTKVTDPANGITKYAYNGTDALTQVTDPKNLATTYTVNGFGETTRQVSPDTGTTNYSHDPAGNLLTRVDSRGAQATHTYDALNRLTSVTYADQTIGYAYDQGINGIGRLTQIGDASGTTAYGYEPAGRVTAKTQTVAGLAHSVAYAYNGAGRLAALTTPSGQVVGYSYANGRIAGITVNGAPLLSQVAYHPFGQVKGWTWGNGQSHARSQDLDGRVSQIAGASTRNYAYDAASRLTALTDPGNPANNQGYGYDALDRLSSATLPGSVTQGFTYDAVGNRLSFTQNGAVTNHTHAATHHRLLGLTGARVKSFSYDTAGNLTGDGSNTFTYDQAGRLTQVSGAASVANTYNALGQRVRKSAPTATTRYFYDEAGRLLGEYTDTGALIQELVWLEGLPVASLRPKSGGGVEIYYVHADHLGTPRVITNADAQAKIVWRWDSDPFGTTLPNEDPDNDGVAFAFNLRFPGQYYDAETNLHYNYFRDYDPSVGRYVQSDPIGLAGGINTYTYVGSNPVRWIDPFGLQAVEICNMLPTPIPHTFVCVGPNCSGKYPSGNPFWSPGSINDDSPNKPSASCYPVPNPPCGGDAFAKCVSDHLNKRGPSGDKYNYLTRNCGEWATNVIERCRRECGQK